MKRWLGTSHVFTREDSISSCHGGYYVGHRIQMTHYDYCTVALYRLCRSLPVWPPFCCCFDLWGHLWLARLHCYEFLSKQTRAGFAGNISVCVCILSYLSSPLPPRGGGGGGGVIFQGFCNLYLYLLFNIHNTYTHYTVCTCNQVGEAYHICNTCTVYYLSKPTYTITHISSLL